MTQNTPSPQQPHPPDGLFKMFSDIAPLLKEQPFLLAPLIFAGILVVAGVVAPQSIPELKSLFYLVAGMLFVVFLGWFALEWRKLNPPPVSNPEEPKSDAESPPEVQSQEQPAANSSAESSSEPADPTAAKLAYLRHLQTVCNTLRLQYIDPKAFESDKMRQQMMRLADVYTTLDTTTAARVEGDKATREEQARPLTALEAATQQRWMVLLGDPGSGKSTFIQHLGFCLASELLEPDAGWLARLGGAWRYGALFPVLVILREFARSAHCDGGIEGLWRFIESQVGDFAPQLKQLLNTGGVLLLFDGLDEVANQDQRALVRDAVAAFAAKYNHPRNRYLVTCRIYAYAQTDNRTGQYLFRLPDPFVDYRLADFSPDRIAAFITAWYTEVYALGWKTQPEADELAGKLRDAVQRPGLAELASRPLLLTVMALLHTTRGRLPDDRVRLYAETVELLLARWQEACLGAESGISRQVNLDQLQTALQKATYDAHLEQKIDPGREGMLADLAEAQLRQALQGCLDGDWNRAGELITFIQERAGLLIENAPGIYTYPHRSFQEYLAAAHLCEQYNFPKNARQLLNSNPAQWREVVLMAVGIMARIKRLPHIALLVVGELCPVSAPVAPAQEITPRTWRAAWHAGDALLEIGLSVARQAEEETKDETEETEEEESLVDRVLDWLAALTATPGALSPAERAAAGETLDRLGWLPPDLDAFILIQNPFLIAKYPVTNAQFARFIEAGGYENPAYWGGEAGRAWRWRVQEHPDYRGKDAITQPEYWDHPRFGKHRRGYPVVGVSWYEAMAYCVWLKEQLKVESCRLQVMRDGQLVTLNLQPETIDARLPTDEEWIAAAGGDEGDRYPWGPEWDPAKANTSESNLGGTTPVALYPDGKSPAGVLDLSGNVWEWLASEYQEGDSSGYALRGGSWYNARYGARVAGRSRDAVFYSYNFNGFRVVVSAPSAVVLFSDLLSSESTL